MIWFIPLLLTAQVALPSVPSPRTELTTASALAREEAETDPADSLLRVASTLMSRGDYRAAADAYRSVARRYPASMRISEAMYYEAFASYRAGDLTRARSALDVMRERYPQQAARGDANALRTRICGELARQGDSDCAEEVTRVSVSASAGTSASPRSGAASPARGGTQCPDGDLEENDTQIAALNALLQMDAERAMPILTNVLARRDRCSERLRRKAVFLVSQKQTRESADILLAAAKNDPDDEVRTQAVFWLAQVRDPRALEILIDIANGNGERAVRERALFALSQHSSPAASAALRTFAENPRESIILRERAIFSLGQRRGDDQTEYLRELYRKVTEPELRDKVLFALMSRRGSGNEAFMLGVVTDAQESLEVRKKAIFYVGQMGATIPQISSLFSTLTDHELREQVIFALSQRREGAALDKLIEIAKTEPDRELRKKAMFWIGQSRDPRATAFLTELLSK
jgi:HEAT repeat protein